MAKTGTLFLVATPIGNLEDLSWRSSRILKEADCIIAESLAKARRLLGFLKIKNKPIILFREDNSLRQLPKVIKMLTTGKKCALISDAGYPLVADPGLSLVQAAIAKNIALESIPGPSAVMAALVVSGFDAHRFAFLGYFPRHQRRREKFWQTLIALSKTGIKTVVFFEAPDRLASALEFLAQKDATLKVVVAKELTKKFAQIYRGQAKDLAEEFSREAIRGEITVILRLP